MLSGAIHFTGRKVCSKSAQDNHSQRIITQIHDNHSQTG
uniref:Uncharacterized protein n=1 Tax=Anguilla anguilla TaxID=7936 RepID=A0A0E9UK06_ANGAN